MFVSKFHRNKLEDEPQFSWVTCKELWTTWRQQLLVEPPRIWYKVMALPGRHTYLTREAPFRLHIVDVSGFWGSKHLGLPDPHFTSFFFRGGKSIAFAGLLSGFFLWFLGGQKLLLFAGLSFLHLFVSAGAKDWPLLDSLLFVFPEKTKEFPLLDLFSLNLFQGG